MNGAISFGVPMPRVGSNVLDGSLGRFSVHESNRRIQNIKFDDPANGLVESGDGAFFSLANRLRQIVDDELSVCSKPDILESYDRPRGTSKVRVPTPVKASDGATVSVARHRRACVEPAATQSDEIRVHGVAGDTDAVVRNSAGIGEQGLKATDGCARGSPIDGVSNSRARNVFNENHHTSQPSAFRLFADVISLLTHFPRLQPVSSRINSPWPPVWN